MFVTQGRVFNIQDTAASFGLRRSRGHRSSRHRYDGRPDYDANVGAYVQELRPGWTPGRKSGGKHRSRSYGSAGHFFSRRPSLQRRPSVQHAPARENRSIYGSTAKTYSQAAKSEVPGYQFVRSLKTGGMSEVINIVSKSGKCYIQKRCSTIDKRSREKRISQSWMRAVRNELAALRSMPHEQNLNNIAASGWSPDNSSCTFILEYCDRGTLQDVLNKTSRWNKLSEDFVWHALLGVARGLSFMHYGIQDVRKSTTPQPGWDPMWHLDLKPSNIFLSSTGQRGAYPRIVVGDFGCVVFASEVRFGRVSSRCQPSGTAEWYPPEERNGEVMAGRGYYGSTTDIWQMGATMHTLCTLLNVPNWPMLSHNPYPCGKKYSEHLNVGIRTCVLNDWTKRYDAVQVVQLALYAAGQLNMPNVV